MNSILLEANGTTLLADPGYMHDWASNTRLDDPDHISYSTKAHNTLLIDNSGQILADSPIAHFQDLSPSNEIDYVVSRLERGYGSQLLKFDRHVYMVNKEFFVVIDEIELTKFKKLTWNFHGLKNAIYSAENNFSICHQGTKLTLQPFGDIKLNCQHLTDHYLPRLQFETSENQKSVTVGWVLFLSNENKNTPKFKANISSIGAIIEKSGNSKNWNLPVVSRRPGVQSDIMIPFPERPGN